MSEANPSESQQHTAPQEEAQKGSFAQSKAHALLIRMFDLRQGGFLGYGALYALCRVVRAIFHTG